MTAPPGRARARRIVGLDLVFPCGDAFTALLREAGFVDARCAPLTLGSVALYVADKS